MEAFSTLKSKSIVVLINTKETGSFEALPRPVQKAFSDPSIGRIIPRLAVFDEKARKHIGSLTYEEIKGEGLREIKKKIAAFEPANKPEPWDGRFDGAEFADWTSAKGTKMRAKPERYNRGKLTLLTEAGRRIEVTPEQLDADSQKRIEELVAAAEGGGEEEEDDI